MGKNRTSYPTTFTFQMRGHDGMPLPPIVLETDGHSPEWMEQLVAAIQLWVGYGVIDINELFTDDQLDYIRNHTEIYYGSLSRVEKSYHFDELNLKVGDKLDLGKIRSFTKENPSKYFMDESIGDYSDGVTVYQLVSSPHFDVNPYNNGLGEDESFVPTDNLTITGIHVYDDADPVVRAEKYEEDNDGLGSDYELLPKKITVVDLYYGDYEFPEGYNFE